MNLKSRSDYGKNHCELQFVPVVSECNWKLRYQKQKSEDTGKIHRSQVQYNKHIREHCWICPEEHENTAVEFVMERTVKGKDGDRATLDVLINEYGKTTLPYASKSGGEKVKASLAIILALSEIKATSAGIQLGMLFIDEPPFLDDDGTQAYVDALETIRQRYPDVKIMAITHDDAMKARFNQSVTVIKAEDGSKVIY